MIFKLFPPRLSLLVALFSALILPVTAQQSAKKTDSDYINSILPQARRIEKEYGIPIDLTLAIARQESGNGDYIIGQNNHFGLRCDSDDCITLENADRRSNTKPVRKYPNALTSLQEASKL